MLYTRRSDRLASHRGQVAFPGGRFDHRDDNLLAAALRETHEEVGIAPHYIRVLGTFPGRRTNATDIAVTPFVGLIEGDPVLTPDPKEVAEIFHVPLAAFSYPALSRVLSMEAAGAKPGERIPRHPLRRSGNLGPDVRTHLDLP